MEYEYASARIRAMKSRLLERKALENLALKFDIDAVISELERTPYQEDIEDASVQHSGLTCVEEALRRNLTKTLRLIFGFVRGEDAERCIKTFLNKWDIQNIKTILRGKNIHEVADEIAGSLAPAGALDNAILAELIKQPDVKAVIDLLATWGVEYARPLTHHFTEYSERRDLVILEYALDKFYYGNALKAVGGLSYDEAIVQGMLRTEIDVVNIKSVLRVIRDKVEPEDADYYFIPRGKELGIDELTAMSNTRTIDRVFKKLASTSYNFLANVPDDYVKTEKISVFEKELDTFLLQKALRMWFGDPLSLALVVAYLWAKYNEITNIRIIALCKTEYVPETEVMGELVLV